MPSEGHFRRRYLLEL